MVLRVCFTLYFLSILKVENIYCRNDYVDSYEVVDFKLIEHNCRHRRSPFIKNSSDGSEFQADLEIRFTSFEKSFNLLLLEDKSFQNTPVHLFTNGASETASVKARFYEGTLNNETDITVLGFVLDDLFTGRIDDGNLVYFVEPAVSFFSDNPQTRKIVVYEDTEIHSIDWKITPKSPWDVYKWETFSNLSINITIKNSGLDISEIMEDVTCSVEVVADKTLYDLFDENIDRLSAVMYFHAKFADYLFKRSDFNMDGVPDGTRIKVGRIFIYKSDIEQNYPMKMASDLTEYLTKFAFRMQKPRFCLSIAMVHKKNAGPAIGEAFKADQKFSTILGGICDKAIPVDSTVLSFNTGVINVWGKNGKPLPLGVTMQAFVHEMGHGFGSDHDSVINPICSPGKFIGNYIMYPVATYGSRNGLKFSPCSRRTISKIISLKGACLQHREPECGNGVREGDEECDCGSMIYCDMIDHCCTPFDVLPPYKGCTFRTDKGYECSPKESECCLSTCRIVKDSQKVCYSDDYKCLYSFCNGMNATCPPPRKVPNALCGLKFSCDGISCFNHTICLAQELETCYCEELNNQCLQCCKKGNYCIPAAELGIRNPHDGPYILPTDTACNDGAYRCDDTGKCIKNHYLIDGSLTVYTSLVVVPFVISAAILIFILASCKKQSRNIGTVVRNNI